MALDSRSRGRDDDDLRRARQALAELFGHAGKPAARKRRIALVGLRGAGKSTLGQMLADDLEVPFLELNREIQRVAGCGVAEITITGPRPTGATNAARSRTQSAPIPTPLSPRRVASSPMRRPSISSCRTASRSGSKLRPTSTCAGSRPKGTSVRWLVTATRPWRTSAGYWRRGGLLWKGGSLVRHERQNIGRRVQRPPRCGARRSRSARRRPLTRQRAWPSMR